MHCVVNDRCTMTALNTPTLSGTLFLLALSDIWNHLSINISIKIFLWNWFAYSYMIYTSFLLFTIIWHFFHVRLISLFYLYDLHFIFFLCHFFLYYLLSGSDFQAPSLCVTYFRDHTVLRGTERINTRTRTRARTHPWGSVYLVALEDNKKNCIDIKSTLNSAIERHIVCMSTSLYIFLSLPSVL